MEHIYNDNTKKQYESLKEMIIIYHDALIDIFGEYQLCTSKKGIIFINSEFKKRFAYIPDSLDKNCICFSNKDEYTYDGFYFSIIKNEILVNEIKVDLHKKGANVELVDRLYGKSRYDKDRNALLDLQSTNYVIKGHYSLGDFMDTDFLQRNSILTTTFSAHMKYFHQTEGEIRGFVSTIYPSHVYFNGEDISQVYEFVDGIDKISRIYNLYSGNVKKESDDIKTIITGLTDENSFNYKNRNIGDQVQVLIEEPMDIDVHEKMIEEYIEQHLGKTRPVIIGLRDATRVEIGITPTQSRKRLDDKIDSIIDTKASSKTKRFIRKFIPPKSVSNK